MSKKRSNDIERFLNGLQNQKGKEEIYKWNPDGMVYSLYIFYLFNKFKTKCMIDDMIVVFNLDIYFTEYEKYIEHFQNLCKKVSQTILTCQYDVVVFPIQIVWAKDNGHANAFIYRKKENTLEHFEPHGSELVFPDLNEFRQFSLKEHLNLFISIFQGFLIRPLHIIRSNEICPILFGGVQAIENQTPDQFIFRNGKNIGPESNGGYCAAWSALIMEMALRYPDVKTVDLLAFMLKCNVKDLIRGYVRHVYTKLNKHFAEYLTAYNCNLFEVLEGERKDMQWFKILLIHLYQLERRRFKMSKKQWLEEKAKILNQPNKTKLLNYNTLDRLSENTNISKRVTSSLTSRSSSTSKNKIRI